MKKAFRILVCIAAVVLGTTACNNKPTDDNDPYKIVLSSDKAEFASTSALPQTIEVKAYDNDWAAESSEQWCKVEKVINNNVAALKITCDNNSGDTRKATIVITYASYFASISVVQQKLVPSIEIPVTEYNAHGDGDTLKVAVTCNTEYKIRVPSSVNWISRLESADPAILQLCIATNNQTTDRSAQIAVMTVDESDSVMLKIGQLGVNPSILISPESATVESDADTTTVDVTTNCKYTVTSSAAWAKLDSKSTDEKALIVYSDNDASSARTATLTFKSTVGAVEKTFTLTQKGYNPSIAVSQDTYSYDFDYKALSIGVTATCKYSVSIPQSASWLVFRQQTTSGVVIDVLANSSGAARSATITLKANRGNCSKTVTVNQAAEPAHTHANIMVPVTSIDVPNSAAGFSTNAITDDKYATSWISTLSGTSAPVIVRFNFKNAPHIDYFMYYPSKPYGEAGSVTLKCNSASGSQTLGTFDLGQSDMPHKFILGQNGIDAVSSITMEINTAKTPDTAPTGIVAGCAEAEFFEYRTFSKLEEVFTDNSCTKLQPAITDETVEHITDTTMRKIAVKLLDPTFSMKFRVCDYSMYPAPTVDANKFHTGTYSICDTPTGMCYIKAGTYTVCLNNPTSYAARLYVVDYNYSMSQDVFKTYTYNLRNGINVIKITGPGHVYMMNAPDDVTDNSKIRAFFPDGWVNGYYNVSTDSDADFAKILYISRLLGHDNDFTTHFDVISPRCILSMPTTQLNSITQTGLRAKQLMNTFDTIVELEERLQGHEKYHTGGHRNHMWLTAIYYSYMYSTAYRTGYNVRGSSDVSNVVMNPTKLYNNIWGPAHEIGHSNQISNRFKWGGMTEVSNNVCSAYVQWCLNGKSTALRKQNDYVTAMRDIMCRENGNHFQAMGTNTFFQKLIPFWQLFLYFDEVKGTDFYPDLYNTLRNLPYIGGWEAPEAGEIQVSFCENASDVAKTDLSDFFKAWGLLTPMPNVVYGSDYGVRKMSITQERIDQAITYMSKYPKPKQAIQFITENNLDLYRTPKTVTAGTVTRNETSQIYSFEGWENAVAYVIYDESGVLRGASPTTTVSCQTYTFDYVDNKGNVGANSSTYYNQANFKATPFVIAHPKCYGVAADGTLIPSTNTL